MKTHLAAFILFTIALPLAAQADPGPIKVTYKILTDTVPETMASINTGVLVSLLPQDDATGKIEVHLYYRAGCLMGVCQSAVLESIQTVSRTRSIAGWVPGSIPVVFAIPVDEVLQVRAVGFTSAFSALGASSSGVKERACQ